MHAGFQRCLKLPTAGRQIARRLATQQPHDLTTTSVFALHRLQSADLEISFLIACSAARRTFFSSQTPSGTGSLISAIPLPAVAETAREISTPLLAQAQPRALTLTTSPPGSKFLPRRAIAARLTKPAHAIAKSREGTHSLSMATMTFNPQTPQSPSQYSPSTADPHSSMNSSMTSVTTASLPTPAHSVNNCDSSHDATMVDADSPNKRKRLADDTGDQEQKKVHLEDPRRLGIQDLHLDVGPKYLLLRTRKASLYSNHTRRCPSTTSSFPCRVRPWLSYLVT